MNDFSDNLNAVLRYSMADEASFHSKIAEDPKEHTASLAFADWLRENGREAEGDFIHSAVDSNDETLVKAVSNGTFRSPMGKRTVIVFRWPDGNNVYLKHHNEGTPEGSLAWLLRKVPDEVAAEHVRKLVAAGVRPVGLHTERMANGDLTQPEQHSVSETAVRYGVSATDADFHRQIHNEPADSVNAGAYADWLQENGRPTQAEVLRRHVVHNNNGGVVTKSDEHSMGPVGGEPFDAATSIFSHPNGGWVVSLHMPSDNGNTLHWNTGELTKGEANRIYNGLRSEGAEHEISDPRFWDAEPHSPTPEKHTVRDRPVRYATVPEITDHYRKFTGALRAGKYDMLPELASNLAAAGPTQAHTVHFHLAHLPTMLKAAQSNPSALEAMRTLWKPLRIPDYAFPDSSKQTQETIITPAKYDNDDQPVRYATVPPHDVADDFKLTGIAPRVGIALNRIASEDSDAGLMAEHVLRTGDTGVLKFLADKLDEDGHRAKDWYDWRHLHRAMQIDKTLQGELGRHQVYRIDPQTGTRVLRPQSAGWTFSDWSSGVRGNLSRRRALESVRRVVSDASRHDVNHSILRLLDNQHIRQTSDPADALNYYPHYSDNTHPTEYRRKAHSDAYLRQLGSEPAEPHNYPDTRPPNKRYRLSKLVAKYAAWKAPAGGMVVKESPLAVVGQFATGGRFTRDLSQLNQQPVTQPQPQQKMTLDRLLNRWRKAKAAVR